MFPDILKEFKFAWILVTILGGSVLARAAGIEGEAHRASGPAFVSACKTSDENPMPTGAIIHAPEGSILAFVHELGQVQSGYEQSYLFAIRDTKSDPTSWGIGWMHWGAEQFFEAEGGMMSAAIARDVFNYLKERPFSLVEDWHSALLGEHQFARCAITYTETERYLEAIGRR